MSSRFFFWVSIRGSLLTPFSRPLDKLHHGLVPAIGGREHVPSPPLDINFQMPPSPIIPPPAAPMGASHSVFARPANIALDLPPDEPDTDLDATSVVGDLDASFSFSLGQVQGRFESVPVWEDDDDGSSGFGVDAEAEKNEGWMG